MQVARSFFFDNEPQLAPQSERNAWWRSRLDHRFTKQQIFELYANEIYIGNRGSFAIRGFGEAAPAYFGKDVRDLTLGEAAFLAGIIRRRIITPPLNAIRIAPRKRATACWRRWLKTGT